MDKVLVERPRGGWRLNKNRRSRRRWRDDPEQARKREPISAGVKTKWLSEHLGPLRRFLASRVGANWDRVYAEIRANISSGNAVQMHILQHLEDYVAIHTRVIDGEVWALDRWGGGMAPLGHRYRRVYFYVCPRSNRLLRFELRYVKPARLGAERIPIAPDRYLRKIDGRWHEITLSEHGYGLGTPFVDALLGAIGHPDRSRAGYTSLERLHGAPYVHASRIRPLSPRELEQLRRARKQQRRS